MIFIICMGDPEERKMNAPKPNEMWKLGKDRGLQSSRSIGLPEEGMESSVRGRREAQVHHVW